MSRIPPTPEEEREWAMTQLAVLTCALRHLASAWHRKHSQPHDPSWVHCEDRFCKMAHDAVEGRYRAATSTPHGTVISLARKEA